MSRDMKKYFKPVLKPIKRRDPANQLYIQIYLPSVICRQIRLVYGLYRYLKF